MSEKRKTYSLDPVRSRELARHALDLGEETEKTVHKQSLLDVLVEALSNPVVYKIVKKLIKKS